MHIHVRMPIPHSAIVNPAFIVPSRFHLDKKEKHGTYVPSTQSTTYRQQKSVGFTNCYNNGFAPKPKLAFESYYTATLTEARSCQHLQ